MSFIYNRTQQICKQLPTPSTGEIIPIYEPALVSANDLVSGIRYNGYVTDLRIRSVVSSLPETPLPEFELGASKTAKMAVVRDLEYASPRFGLEILLSCEGSPYLPIFEFALHNRQPFFVTEVLSYLTNQPALALAPDASLAVRFKDVGYGFPQGTDEFVVYGVAREEAIQPSVASGTNLSPIIVPLAYEPNYPPTTPAYWENRFTAIEGAGLGILNFSVTSLNTPTPGDVILAWDEAYSAQQSNIMVRPLYRAAVQSADPLFFAISGNSLVYAAPSGTIGSPLEYAVGSAVIVTR